MTSRHARVVTGIALVFVAVVSPRTSWGYCTGEGMPNPAVGSPFATPPNAATWKVINIDCDPPHVDGPFALPDAPNTSNLPVVDPNPGGFLSPLQFGQRNLGR